MGAKSLPRQNEGILQPLERPALRWLASRMPPFVTPDLLTSAGFLGAIITGVGYWLASHNPNMLLLACAGLFLNWFGDSLDGTLARYRRIERPTYGFFVDHTTDVFEQVIIAVGMAYSGFFRFELAILGLLVYLLLSVHTFVRAHFIKVLTISYSGFGPTELRFALVLLNLAIVLFPPEPFQIFGLTATYPNCFSVLWSFLGSVVLFGQIRGTLRDLKQSSYRATEQGAWHA